MIKQIITLGISIITITLRGYSQEHLTSYEVQLQEKTPPSPNAGSINRYIDFPVNMATGVPNIQIPIYSIKSGNISIPIVLSYHSGGIKVNEKAGWVGLGWSLNPGGSIIKKTNGLDDIYLTSGTSNITPTQDYLHPDYTNISYNPGYTNMTDAVEGFMNAGTGLKLDSNLRFMGKILIGQNDGEADDFNYTLPDRSGKFYYNQKLGKFQTNKTDGLKISGDTTGWSISSPNGLTSYFSQKEHTLNPLYQKGLSSQASLITSWYVTNIEDVVNNKEVNFEYENFYTTDVYNGESVTNDYSLSNGLYLYAQHGEVMKRTGDNFVLKTIRTENETINFIKDTATRQDGAGPKALKEIQIYNKDSVLLKKVLFTYYYLLANDSGSHEIGGDGKRLILNSVQEVNYDEKGASQTTPPFYFKYDTVIKLPWRLSFAQDKWGFYNGKHANSSLIPHNPYFQYYSSIVGANRNVDSHYVKAGVLNSVIYPTGGRAIFEFESNRSDTILAGGLRIKKITYYDSVATSSIVSEYHYPGNYTFWTPVFWYQLQHLSNFTIFGNQYSFTFTPLLRVESEPIAQSFINQGSPGYYSLVEQIKKSSQGDLLSKHYFAGYSEPMDEYLNIMNVPHPKIAEIDDIKEYQTENYKREINGSYTLIQKDSSAFARVENTSDYIWNAKGAWNWNQEEWCEWPGGDPFIYAVGYMIFNISPSVQAYKEYPSLLINNEHYSKYLSSTGTLQQYSSSQYDSTNGNLVKDFNVDSKGDTIIHTYKYASDFIHTGSYSGMNLQIDSLIDVNYLTAPIEILTIVKKKDSINSIIQAATLYEYRNLKINKVYKCYGDISYNSFNQSYNDSTGFYKDSHYQLTQEITEFDNLKNPVTILTLGEKESYIWDSTYLVAKTINATSSEIAYTSFESSQKGNWTYSGTTSIDTTGITGKKVYLTSNGNITKTDLTSGAYIVSYWGKNGNINVNGSGPSLTGKTIGNWTYYEHKITGTSITISGSHYIDELRLYPENGLMTTLSYKPLIGITSQCDANNRLVYYEYYAPGQVKLIRDEDGNIVKRFEYKYQTGTWE